MCTFSLRFFCILQICKGNVTHRQTDRQTDRQNDRRTIPFRRCQKSKKEVLFPVLKGVIWPYLVKNGQNVSKLSEKINFGPFVIVSLTKRDENAKRRDRIKSQPLGAERWLSPFCNYLDEDYQFRAKN